MPLRSAGLTLKASPALKCGHRTGGNPLLAGLTLKETKFRLASLGGFALVTLVSPVAFRPTARAPSGQAISIWLWRAIDTRVPFLCYLTFQQTRCCKDASMTHA